MRGQNLTSHRNSLSPRIERHGDNMNRALEAEGQTYQGFLITKYLPLPELQSTLIELVHEETGARIIQIANSDPENLFSLSFQTLPNSSNGAAHILEHTVLCGSKKFPVKDPFFSHCDAIPVSN